MKLSFRNSRFYDWKRVELEIENRFGNFLRQGEHAIILEDESEEIFGKSIKKAMLGRCLLEEGTSPLEVTPTIPRHLGLIGYSSRVGRRHGRRYVEIWLPTEYITVREFQPYISMTERKAPIHAPTDLYDVSRLKVGHQEDLERFYQLIDQMSTRIGGTRLLSECDGTMDWPKKGVYFFFEPSEYNEDGNTLRVVRVGTHAVSRGSSSTLWERLRAHRGYLSGRHAGGGNHRGSIFRKLVGYALLEKRKLTSDFSTWGEGQSAKPRIRDLEHPIEVEVSKHIGQMPFLWLDVDDEPGKYSHRKIIERGSIALLSNLNKSKVIDPPSVNWLGRLCPKVEVCKSGLWNSQHTDEKYDAGFLRVLERYVSQISTSQNITDSGYPKRILILMPCSGRKRGGGNQEYCRVNGRRMLDLAPENYKDMLSASRKEVAKAIGEQAGPDLGYPTNERSIAFLPAFKRYDGNLYREIPERAWQNLRRSTEVDVVIVSGLYGLIFWDEPTRYYNVAMNQTVWPGRRLCTWWNRNGLPRLLAAFLKKAGYSEVHNYLSTHYRVAVKGYQILHPSIRVHTHEYSGLGSGADYHRGRDIAEFLLSLTKG